MFKIVLRENYQNMLIKTGTISMSKYKQRIINLEPFENAECVRLPCAKSI